MTPDTLWPTGSVIYWYRNDLRLHDNPSLQRAITVARQQGVPLQPVFVHDPGQQRETPWDFTRQSPYRQAWWCMALDDLSSQLSALGSRLIECQGEPGATLAALATSSQAQGIWCEAIAAPEEQDVEQRIRQAGVSLHTHWQSSLLDPSDLPFTPERVPDVFTAFRQAVEQAGVHEAAVAPTVTALPPAWPQTVRLEELLSTMRHTSSAWNAPTKRRTSFPWHTVACHGGERAALRHLQRYCSDKLPHTYKATRNALSDERASSKWSPWLATGALSAREAMRILREFEAEHGANDGSYWLWFELLWRDHFRFLHHKYGRQLYRGRGLLKGRLATPHDPTAFRRWCQGHTGHTLIDAGMRELAATGLISNRLRQIVASYLIHDLACDWRAGAAWFESQLIDYDVYSNQGNWLYISGRGTDPRGGRRFNPDKQAQDHDPDGRYRQRWAQP